jgi:hypothetical protein
MKSEQAIAGIEAALGLLELSSVGQRVNEAQDAGRSSSLCSCSCFSVCNTSNI